ncbi:hypothetical protein HPP92_012575 [Vanilla planifolia]|uniref:STAS domain-containing protein n=1 Tax=Vanilla planifolia TaxID=51239 RepID=A0A835V190_VANPL|nr:hypothetical protein HPP92_012575 [Vanilla planifolia]
MEFVVGVFTADRLVCSTFYAAVLGRLPGTTVYRNIEQYPEAYVYVGIVVVRIDAPLYFANISYIKDRLRQYELVVAGPKYNGSNDERIYFVIIEMAPVPYLDSSAVQALKDLYQEYKSREIQIAIFNPSRKVLQTLSRAGFIELLGKSWYFVSVHDAVKACLQEMPNLPGSIPRIGDQSPRRTHGFAQKQWRQQSGDECSLSQEPLLLQKEIQTPFLGFHLPSEASFLLGTTCEACVIRGYEFGLVKLRKVGMTAMVREGLASSFGQVPNTILGQVFFGPNIFSPNLWLEKGFSIEGLLTRVSSFFKEDRLDTALQQAPLVEEMLRSINTIFTQCNVRPAGPDTLPLLDR